MATIEKIQRAVAFYLSVTVFFTLLPILLSYSLGYKIDYRPFKIYKTGILYINSQPQDASVFINGKKIAGLTPARIEELKPAIYNVEVRRDGYYPWEQELAVRPNMVTKADRIILFPIIQNMRKISNRETYDFTISDKNGIYYMTPRGLFRSDMDGAGYKRIAPFSNWPKDIRGKKFYSNGTRFLLFTEKSVYVVYLNLDKALTEDGEIAKVEEAVKLKERIVDVFWYSMPSYVIVVTENGINVAELRRTGKQNVVSLYKFNERPQGLYYDDANDSLYFTDAGKSSDGMKKIFLYRLDLRQKFFDTLMKQLLRKETDTGAGYEKK